jgi:hypothetical protein
MALSINTQLSGQDTPSRSPQHQGKKSDNPAIKTSKFRIQIPSFLSIEMPLLTALVLAILFYAWLQRNEGHITAETGIGYYLGITGSLLMLALMLYPLRKRIRVLRFIGNVRTWFRIHMILGVIGPALIILHSNFTLGSLNGTMALSAMLIVAISGFVGRFFYARIHRGLYGHKLNAKELIEDVGDIKTLLGDSDDLRDDITPLITAYEESRLVEHIGFWRSLCLIFTGPFARYGLKKKLVKYFTSVLNSKGILKRDRHEKLAKFNKTLDRYFRAVGRAEAFTFYERLFALWHLLHLPLFVILVLAAITHVVAVHLF